MEFELWNSNYPLAFESQLEQTGLPVLGVSKLNIGVSGIERNLYVKLYS